MSDITQEELYVYIIKELYGSSIYVDEGMISDEVIDIVDTILNEIRACNLRSAVFTTTVNALAVAMQDAWENFGIPNPKKFLTDLLNGDKNFLKNQYQSFGKTFGKEFVKQWVAVLTNQRQARICVVSAARNYKSALAIALLGL